MNNKGRTEPISFREWLSHATGAIFALLLTVAAACLFSAIVLVSFYVGVEWARYERQQQFKNEVEKLGDSENEQRQRRAFSNTR